MIFLLTPYMKPHPFSGGIQENVIILKANVTFTLRSREVKRVILQNVKWCGKWLVTDSWWEIWTPPCRWGWSTQLQLSSGLLPHHFDWQDVCIWLSKYCLIVHCRAQVLWGHRSRLAVPTQLLLLAHQVLINQSTFNLHSARSQPQACQGASHSRRLNQLGP